MIIFIYLKIFIEQVYVYDTRYGIKKQMSYSKVRNKTRKYF